MQRRALLARGHAMLSSAALVTLAGCSNPFSSTESYPETQETEVEGVDRPCPNRFDTSHTICSTSPAEGPQVSLTTNSRTMNFAASGVPATRVTITNDTRDEVALLIKELRRFEDGAWQPVTAWDDNTVVALARGETKTWSLSPRVHPTPSTVEPVVHDFEPGDWAFTVAVELTPEHAGQQAIELSTGFTVVDSGD